jgi:hypothetical protein
MVYTQSSMPVQSQLGTKDRVTIAIDDSEEEPEEHKQISSQPLGSLH